MFAYIRARCGNNDYDSSIKNRLQTSQVSSVRNVIKNIMLYSDCVWLSCSNDKSILANFIRFPSDVTYKCNRISIIFAQNPLHNMCCARCTRSPNDFSGARKKLLIIQAPYHVSASFVELQRCGITYRGAHICYV